MTTVTVNGTTYDSDTSFSGYLYLTALLAFASDILADATQNMVATSTTSYTLGAGSGTITMSAALPAKAGAFFILADAAAPTTNYALIQASSDASGTSLSFTEVAYAGSGTKTSWTLNPSGMRGAAGTLSGNASGAIDMNGNTLTVDTATFNEGSEAKFLAAGTVSTDQSYDETTERDIQMTVSAAVNLDFETPNIGMTYSHVLWITQDGTGGRVVTIRDGSNTEATWLGTEPDWSGLAASAITIVSVFYAPSGTLYAAEVTQ